MKHTSLLPIVISLVKRIPRNTKPLTLRIEKMNLETTANCIL